MTKGKKISAKRKRELNQEVAPLAQEFRNKIIDEDRPINNTFDILDSLGYFVLRFPTSDDNLSGFHIKKGDYDCVYINTKHTLARQYYSAWHEVYHIITGVGSGPSFKSEFNTDEDEYKAECFASHILIPTELLKKKMLEEQMNIKTLNEYKVVKLQNYFNVSYTAMLMKLKDVFPTFNKGYLFSYASKKNQIKLINVTKNVGGNLDLIKPTNDFIVPKSFLEDVSYNYDNNRISEKKVKQLMMLLNESKVKANEL